MTIDQFEAIQVGDSLLAKFSGKVLEVIDVHMPNKNVICCNGLAHFPISLTHIQEYQPIPQQQGICTHK